MIAWLPPAKINLPICSTCEWRFRLATDLRHLDLARLSESSSERCVTRGPRH